MKILLIGGRGTIGRAVANGLSGQHQLIVAGRTSGDVHLDLADSASIRSMFENTPGLDAVVCTAGEAKWDRLEALSEQDYYIGIKSKLMGQVNLVCIGKDFINPGGSFTLTTGILAERPVPMTCSAAMVNGAIHSFVMAAALELERGIRVNAVSAGLVEDSAEKYADYFPGHTPVPMAKVAAGYASAVEGRMTGQVLRVYE